MGKPPRVVGVEHLRDYVLTITFSDGVVRELDFAPTVAVGVLANLADPDTFARVEVDEAAGTISWSCGIDFDPDVLHGGPAASADFAPLVMREYRLRPTA
jgi:Protein of unknown function (DUF2442)